MTLYCIWRGVRPHSTTNVSDKTLYCIWWRVRQKGYLKRLQWNEKTNVYNENSNFCTILVQNNPWEVGMPLNKFRKRSRTIIPSFQKSYCLFKKNIQKATKPGMYKPVNHQRNAFHKLDRWILNGISTHLELFYAKRLGNCVQSAFILTFLCRYF